MCLAYLLYYPKIPLQACETAPGFYSLMRHFGIYHYRYVIDTTSISENDHHCFFEIAMYLTDCIAQKAKLGFVVIWYLRIYAHFFQSSHAC